MIEVRIHRRAAERLAAGHVWVYRSDVLGTVEPPAGGVVQVLDSRNRRLGRATYSSKSQIALRMLPSEVDVLDTALFRRMFRRAQEYRDLVVGDTDAYRLIHSEADLLPGLVVDRYGGWFSIQTQTQAMEAAKAAVVEALMEEYEPTGVVERNDASGRGREGLERRSGVLRGPDEAETAVRVHGVVLKTDLLASQKTGLFLDQRENWRAAGELAAGRALDCFSYHGGFSLQMAGKCESVLAVDSSKPALERIRVNARLNDLENIEPFEANVFDALSDFARGRRTFDRIVLDPPAFAKSRKHIEAAGRAYKEINLKALALLDPGGILVTCSCSHHFSEADLLSAVAQASLDAGKRLRVIERRTQARCHPIALTVPETHYLKCLILQVM